MIIILISILAFLMIAIGGERGIKSFITLLGNAVILIAAIYLMANGWNIILVSIVMILLLCVLTLFFQNGNNKKSRTSFYVVIIVSLLMFVLVAVIVHFANISGFNEINLKEDDAMYYNTDIAINMVYVAIATVIIGILGVVKDAAVAITSGIYEVHKNHPQINQNELFFAGMHMGYDILGTAVNTLFFATVGESMLLIHKFFWLSYSLSELINSKAFFQEMLLFTTGAIGIVVCIPIASFIMVKLLFKDPPDIIKEEDQEGLQGELVELSSEENN